MLTVDDRTVACLRELHGAYEAQEATGKTRGYIAAHAVSLLGPLSPWWLTLHALRLARDARPDLVPERYLDTAAEPTGQPGLCFTLFAWCCELKPAPGDQTLLRPSVVLPVRWRRGHRHDRTLPAGLLDVADRVRRLMNADDFGLTWPDRLTGLDASGLSATADSAFVALAAGLLLAKHSGEGRPNPRVWATGAWDEQDREVDRVEQVEAKIQTCIQFGAERIFVPADDARRARRYVRKLARDPDIIQPLPVQADLDRVVGTVAVEFWLEPPVDARLNLLISYYNFLARYGRHRLTDFALKRLINARAQRCRERLPESLKLLPDRNPVLVTTLSLAPDLIELAQAVFRPRHVVLIYLPRDPGPRKRYGRLIEQWKNRVSVDEYAFEPDDTQRPDRWAKGLYEHLTTKFANAPILVDHTPGPKPVSVGLLVAAPPGVHHIYLDHRYTADSVPEPLPVGYVDFSQFLAGRTIGGRP